MALFLVWTRHRAASGRTQRGFSLGENVTTADFRKNFLADGVRMGRPRKYRSWCWVGTKGIPALGGNWGRMTPGVPSTSDSLWFCGAELRASPRHPSGFIFLMDLFRVPQFDSFLLQATLEDNRAQCCHFSPSCFLSDPSPLLYSISGFLFFNLLSKNIKENVGVLAEPQRRVRLCFLW